MKYILQAHLCAIVLAPVFCHGLNGQVVDLMQRNIANGTTLPASCNSGDIYILGNAAPGQNIYAGIISGGSCTWVLQAGGSFGAIGSNQLVSNITGSSAVPVGNALSAIFDSVFGSTRGSVLCRGASSWTRLNPGTSGYFLQTQGSGADCQWAAGGQPALSNNSIWIGNGSNVAVASQLISQSILQNYAVYKFSSLNGGPSGSVNFSSPGDIFTYTPTGNLAHGDLYWCGDIFGGNPDCQNWLRVPALANANTWSAGQKFTGLSTGTQVACLGLDSGNNLVLNAGACGSGGGGSSLSVNGATVTNPNFAGTPPAGAGYAPVTWQASGSSVSAEVQMGNGLTVCSGAACIGPSVVTFNSAQNNVVYCISSTGNTSYVCSLVSQGQVLTAYQKGQRVMLVPDTATTTTATLNIDGLGAKTVDQADCASAISTQISANLAYDLWYNGTVFCRVN